MEKITDKVSVSQFPFFSKENKLTDNKRRINYNRFDGTKIEGGIRK